MVVVVLAARGPVWCFVLQVQTEARGETVACCMWVLVEGKQGQEQALRQQTTQPQQAPTPTQ